ncbi:hypothetical protein RB195_015786 [Necator americanus]|uniref:Uncharacterized protein n=1 Tax=Necator americanus TaxID=51031 RepID=A0ABR1E6N1_NECAM
MAKVLVVTIICAVLTQTQQARDVISGKVKRSILKSKNDPFDSSLDPLPFTTTKKKEETKLMFRTTTIPWDPFTPEVALRKDPWTAGEFGTTKDPFLSRTTSKSTDAWRNGLKTTTGNPEYTIRSFTTKRIVFPEKIVQESGILGNLASTTPAYEDIITTTKTSKSKWRKKKDKGRKKKRRGKKDRDSKEDEWDRRGSKTKKGKKAKTDPAKEFPPADIEVMSLINEFYNSEREQKKSFKSKKWDSKRSKEREEDLSSDYEMDSRRPRGRLPLYDYELDSRDLREPNYPILPRPVKRNRRLMERYRLANLRRFSTMDEEEDDEDQERPWMYRKRYRPTFLGRNRKFRWEDEDETDVQIPNYLRPGKRNQKKLRRFSTMDGEEDDEDQERLRRYLKRYRSRFSARNRKYKLEDKDENGMQRLYTY